MTKKYIDIKETRGEPTFKDEKQDVIFYYSYYDRWYDHVGESLGNFYDVGYEADGEIYWRTVRTGDYAFNFDRNEYLENINPDGDFKFYINKNKKKDIEITTDEDDYWVIIYKGKYRFNYNPSSGH